MINRLARLHLVAFVMVLIVFLVSAPKALGFDPDTQYPFKVVLETKDPPGVKSTWKYAYLAFEVQPGTELVLIGMEQEPYMKVDPSGGVYFNEYSSTWWGTSIGGAENMKKTAENFSFAKPPRWEKYQEGRVFSIYEDRITYREDMIDPLAVEGSVLYHFSYKVLLNGEPFIYDGELQYAPSLAPELAAEMVENTKKALGLSTWPDPQGTVQPAPQAPPASWNLYVLVPAVLVVGTMAAWYLVKKTRKPDSGS